MDKSHQTVATTLNRYSLSIPSCSSVLDVEDFSGSEGLSRNYYYGILGNDSNLLIVFYVQIMPDDFVMQLHRF
mgnify:CR=1 FL=1